MNKGKEFLSVFVKKPNYLVNDETNIFPVSIKSVVRCIRYRFKLTQLEETRLPKNAYNMLFYHTLRRNPSKKKKVKIKTPPTGLESAIPGLHTIQPIRHFIDPDVYVGSCNVLKIPLRHLTV